MLVYYNNIFSAGNNSAWNALIHYLIEKWKNMLMSFVVGVDHGPILVVKYEDLQSNGTNEVLRMLKFLGMDYSPGQVATILESDNFSQYYRNHTDNFEHYTPDQKVAINAAILHFIDQLKQAGLPDEIGLNKFIRV